MSRRIRIILILASICSIGIVLLQLYWINNSYQVTKEQLLKDLNLALEKSVAKEMEMRYQSKAKYFMNNGNSAIIGISHREKLPMKIDSILNSIDTVKGQDRTFSLNFGSYSHSSKGEKDEVPEKIELRLKEILNVILLQELGGDFHADPNLIDSLFTEEIHIRGINYHHYIEIIDQKKDSIFYSNAQNIQDTIHSMETRSYPASILGNYRVKVKIPNDTQIILLKMSQGIAASLLLILLLLLSFVYMIRTIFKQKQLSEIKNDFINNMTHELKTPIATVKAAVEAMTSFGVLEDKEKTNKYLNLSEKELVRLSDLVEKVLNMSREEKEPVQMSFEQLDLSELCENIISSRKLKQSNKKLEINFQKKGSCQCTADRFHLVNVIQNLLENSIKYSRDQVSIHMICEELSTGVRLIVSDNGIGIHRKHLSKIFDQFYRVPTGAVHNVKGFGLGLHYVKNIIDKHSASIEVDSTFGKGTVFTIEIPR
jgi:two-component system phosphate regulon sensor histidine kinase PhoR